MGVKQRMRIKMTGSRCTVKLAMNACRNPLFSQRFNLKC
ncbi:hypothetical protein POX_b02583 [Penicillium oxalicum]|nr:hypothetical protein POX_b02583 [Penicillium oxalicum]KAI2792545.1 hypothetical protein POX_b02583 [Penicillium oxalicum]